MPHLSDFVTWGRSKGDLTGFWGIKGSSGGRGTFEFGFLGATGGGSGAGGVRSGGRGRGDLTGFWGIKGSSAGRATFEFGFWGATGVVPGAEGLRGGGRRRG